MGEDQAAQLRPITAADIGGVADFLNSHLNSRVSAKTWASAIAPPWQVETPNHGFMLTVEGRTVGVHLAFYSEREVAGAPERFCNLAAWCVDEAYRSQGLRLLRALLSQRGYHFTDLSPSGNVVELNRRLRMKEFPGTTTLIPYLPRWTSGTVQLISAPDQIAKVLSGDERSRFQDHRTALAARHLVVKDDERTCYLIYRKDRRKGLPLFASLLHASDPDLLGRSLAVVQRHMLIHDGILALLADSALIAPPRLSRTLTHSRPRMYKSSTLSPDQIGLLYSELTCVPW